eukprot:3409129-Rhodomonas_salina.1
MVLTGLAPEAAEKLTIRQQYDKRDQIRTLFRYSETATEMAIQQPMSWLLIVIHVCPALPRFEMHVMQHHDTRALCPFRSFSGVFGTFTDVLAMRRMRVEPLV